MHGVVRDSGVADELLRQHPETHLVERQAPVAANAVDGRRHDEQADGGRPWDGQSYWPNARPARRPTIEPIAMPIIDGAIIWLRPAIIAIICSSPISVPAAGGRPSDTASSVNSGRYASSVRCAQTPLVTG